ncbi:AMP-binding protein [Streptomyces zagrosensis]|uniref:Cyclohexanecarboxylate-CoA ligase n=1 Tax=Streptomyces zagrosensis TaxID=1042984 RepID=A0A7W9QG59_9ACTN|nr:AMP-binding protein [Streptomyces zagrosensis]MBB5938622.1 cyclohexanecarboxylate-CoA ligase [Streptomyces zagrosensis]
MTGALDAVGPAPEAARRYREQGWWRDTTFSDSLRCAARQEPKSTALLTWRRRENRLVRLSFAELDLRADAVAEALRGLGVRRGEVVACRLPSWWETAVLMVACLRAGAVVAPLPLLFGPYETERALATTGAVACAVPDEWGGVPHARVLAEQASRLPRLRHRIIIGDASDTGGVSLRASFNGERVAAERGEPLGPDAVCALLFSSGTTGRSHIVAHSSNTLLAGLDDRAQTLGSDGRVCATTGGLNYSSGLRQLMRILELRVPALYSDCRDPGRWLDLIADTGVTDVRTSPRKLRTLTDEQRRRPRDLSRLRVVHSLAGPLPPVLLTAVQETLCPVVLNTWGMTETSSLISTGPADPAHWAGHSIGLPHICAQTRLLPETETDAETQTKASAGSRPRAEAGVGAAAERSGEVLRLWVRGPQVCLATLDRDTGRVLWSPAHDDGWLDTGDLVSHDGSGGLRFVGRVAERIGDRWLIPVADVEHALLTYPGIRDAVLVPWTDPDGHEVPCAIVISTTLPHLPALRAHLRARYGFHESYLPVRVARVDAFPLTELGKVRRRVLADRLRTTQ